jgi:ribosomal protein S18 acetylase RimI-like enzyme
MKMITGSDGHEYLFRKLEMNDKEMLSEYFAALSAETKSRFGPHPLTDEFAAHLCSKTGDSADRFVIVPKNEAKIVGYFIVGFELSPHEKGRYFSQGIKLEQGMDVLFAPSVADDYQNCGLASRVMQAILFHARQKGARSLVLMGGTQATNSRAIAFYEKFGFIKYGGYQTEVFNHDMRLEISEERL